MNRKLAYNIKLLYILSLNIVIWNFVLQQIPTWYCIFIDLIAEFAQQPDGRHIIRLSYIKINMKRRQGKPYKNTGETVYIRCDFLPSMILQTQGKSHKVQANIKQYTSVQREGWFLMGCR